MGLRVWSPPSSEPGNRLGADKGIDWESWSDSWQDLCPCWPSPTAPSHPQVSLSGVGLTTWKGGGRWRGFRMLQRPVSRAFCSLGLPWLHSDSQEAAISLGSSHPSGLPGQPQLPPATSTRGRAEGLWGATRVGAAGLGVSVEPLSCPAGLSSHQGAGWAVEAGVLGPGWMFHCGLGALRLLASQQRGVRVSLCLYTVVPPHCLGPGCVISACVWGL